MSSPTIACWLASNLWRALLQWFHMSHAIIIRWVSRAVVHCQIDFWDLNAFQIWSCSSCHHLVRPPSNAASHPMSSCVWTAVDPIIPLGMWECHCATVGDCWWCPGITVDVSVPRLSTDPACPMPYSLLYGRFLQAFECVLYLWLEMHTWGIWLGLSNPTASCFCHKVGI